MAAKTPGEGNPPPPQNPPAVGTIAAPGNVGPVAQPRPAAAATPPAPATTPAPATAPAPAPARAHAAPAAPAAAQTPEGRLVRVKVVLAQARALEARVRGAHDAARSLASGGDAGAARHNAALATKMAEDARALEQALAESMAGATPGENTAAEIAAEVRGWLSGTEAMGEAAVAVGRGAVDTRPPNFVMPVPPSVARRRERTVRVFWDAEPGEDLRLTDDCTIKAGTDNRITGDELRRLRNRVKSLVLVPAKLAKQSDPVYLATNRTTEV